MREILFRGKRIDNGEWLVSRTLLQNSDDERFCWMPVYGDKFGTVEDDKGNILRMEYGTLYRVNPVTVGQYTGLKDKHGRRIFEGDELSWHNGSGAVNFGCGCFCVRLHGEIEYYGRNSPAIDVIFNLYPEFEVIGNIHDNPELLEVR